jgi:hypothetical protein
MIELPRACFVANRIAEHADFFSFGTNDLTQTALGFSRDDAESKFVPVYLERNIIDRSPFETIDRPGVGWLVRLAAWVGRAGPCCNPRRAGTGECSLHVALASANGQSRPRIPTREVAPPRGASPVAAPHWPPPLFGGGCERPLV